MIELQGRLIRQSLQFEYVVGAVRPVHTGIITPWRTLPYACLSHVTGGEWWVEREDAAPYTVHSGEATYLPSGVPHRLDMISDGTTIARWAHFNIFLGGYFDVCALVDMPHCLNGSTAQRIGEILESLAEPSDGENWLMLTVARKILEFELTALLFDKSLPKYESEARLGQLQRIRPALDAIHADIAAEFPRERLAALVHLSPSRFASVFKEALGLSPSDYIIKLRMQRAQQMLIGTPWRIEQIAAEVGYSDAHYFSRLFKARNSLSPRQYRTMVLDNLE